MVRQAPGDGTHLLQQRCGENHRCFPGGFPIGLGYLEKRVASRGHRKNRATSEPCFPRRFAGPQAPHTNLGRAGSLDSQPCAVPPRRKWQTLSCGRHHLRHHHPDGGAASPAGKRGKVANSPRRCAGSPVGSGLAGENHRSFSPFLVVVGLSQRTFPTNLHGLPPNGKVGTSR